jgi:hypothetical protein
MLSNDETDGAVNADLVLAFPRKSSKGTYDCINQAKRLGLKVTVIPLDS